MSRQVMLVQVDTASNHNKFYELTLDPDGNRVHARWGRVGVSGQQQTYTGGLRTFDVKLNEKRRKGYTEVDVATGDHRGAATEKLRQVSLAGLAAAGFEDDPRLTEVVEQLVSMNAHQITDLSGGKLTIVNGQVTTPLGLLTAPTLDRAGAVLHTLEGESDAARRRRLIEEYLSLVPQQVGARAGWADDWLRSALPKQGAFLRQLRDSLDFATTQTANVDPAVNPYRVRLAPVDVTDPRFGAVSKLFNSSRNSNHPTASMRLSGLFAVTSPTADPQFDRTAATLGNVQQLWHGTSAANVLSIFAKGLVVPATARHGRMFGNGVYFSNQSTKSLNYSFGMWDRTSTSRCFMLLNDVAMGWEYRPNLHGVLSMSAYNLVHGMTDPQTGRKFNSISVKAGTAGVQNHEAIVWNNDQFTVRYLCEFSC